MTSLPKIDLLVLGKNGGERKLPLQQRAFHSIDPEGHVFGHLFEIVHHHFLN